MKKLFIFIIAISSFSIKAQTKQNDASWYETIKFLRDNIHYFNVKSVYVSNGRKSTSQFMISISNNYDLTVRRVSSGYLSNSTTNWKVSLYDLTDAKMSPGFIKFLKSSVDVNNGKSKTQQLFLPLNKYREYKTANGKDELVKATPILTEDMKNRIKKAWIHLAYLANEKRKKSKF